MAKPIDECRTVAELLEVPERWCRGAFARDANGYPCQPLTIEAESFCLHGAMLRVYRDLAAQKSAHLELIHAAGCGLQAYNDTPGRRHSEIVRVAQCAGR